MHEREKSDPAIGAGKPTNKAEASAHAEHGVSDAAELVEQRAGAKGNADEQSTHRTQGRERVSQALERVRKAARLRKEEKFTALLHHITTSRHSAPSVTTSGVSGCARCGAAVRRTASHGSGSQSWPMTSSRNPKSFTHGRVFALPSPPKVGAVCLNWARTDLCGGRGVILVPTAIESIASPRCPPMTRRRPRQRARAAVQRGTAIEVQQIAGTSAARAAMRQAERLRTF
jgi:hypothetical protein